MNNSLIANSSSVLRNAHGELHTACEFLSVSLEQWYSKLSQATYLSEVERESAMAQYQLLFAELAKLNATIGRFKDSLDSISKEKELQLAIAQRNAGYSLLRMCLTQFASLVTCLNWQSPSIKSSAQTRIGVEREAVVADWNDYKRDRSEDTFYVESLLNQHVVKTENANVEPVLNIFNSGMGAFTSILYFLVAEKIAKNKVMASGHIYVENRMILREFFPQKLITFDTNDTTQIIDMIKTEKPNVVFIEQISNTKDLRLFDVAQIIKQLNDYREEIYLIIDVTCSMGFEDVLKDYSLPANVKVILHGSILKSPQLGLERVNIGFVQSFGLGKQSEKILDYRTLSGTNIQDFASNSLPHTNRELLRLRMQTIQKNAVKLAEAMAKIDKDKKLLASVIYPGIGDHPDHERSKVIGFAGFFFNLQLVKEFNNDKYFEMYTAEVINLAKERGCDVVHGASFGFNQTSIYYSVGWDEPENHYIRISTGTETPYELEKIQDVLVTAFINSKENLVAEKLI